MFTQNDLSNFYGSEQLYFNPLFRQFRYTDGVKFISDHGAAWLIIDIMTYISSNPKLKNQDFISVKLFVRNNKGILTFDDGNDNVLFRQTIDYTDFPLPEITFFVEYNTIMLPSER